MEVMTVGRCMKEFKSHRGLLGGELRGDGLGEVLLRVLIEVLALDRAPVKANHLDLNRTA